MLPALEKQILKETQIQWPEIGINTVTLVSSSSNYVYKLTSGADESNSIFAKSYSFTNKFYYENSIRFHSVLQSLHIPTPSVLHSTVIDNSYVYFMPKANGERVTNYTDQVNNIVALLNLFHSNERASKFVSENNPHYHKISWITRMNLGIYDIIKAIQDSPQSYINKQIIETLSILSVFVGFVNESHLRLLHGDITLNKYFLNTEKTISSIIDLDHTSIGDYRYDYAGVFVSATDCIDNFVAFLNMLTIQLADLDRKIVLLYSLYRILYKRDLSSLTSRKRSIILWICGNLTQN